MVISETFVRTVTEEASFEFAGVLPGFNFRAKICASSPGLRVVGWKFVT